MTGDTLGARYSLAPGAALDADAGVLWMRRRNPVERWIATAIHRGEGRVKIRLDATSLSALRFIVDHPGATGADVAAHLGAAPDDATPAAVERRAALALFLDTLRRSRALVTEPI